MKPKFKMEPHTPVDKSFAIYSDAITLRVDYDDVDHPTVQREAKRILVLLNRDAAGQASQKEKPPKASTERGK